ncbi:MAG: NADH-quinone oxidoreductase subunit I [Anaerolineae bacterium]|nr:NADH-quinone oxidoreductase subunit I [Anaerolineae bacterium]
MIRDSIVGLWQVLRAMGLTLKYFFTRPVTIQYPKEPVPLYPRFRGGHQLLFYEEGPYKGLERCIGCSLCAAYCPTQCIYVQAAENKDGVQRSPGERYAEVYEINMLRCMFCGYCEEACPTGAIVLRREFALADYSRKGLLYGQERLQKPQAPNAVIRSDSVDSRPETGQARRARRARP